MVSAKSQSHTVILKSDPYISFEDAMEFRLIYSGQLLGASRNTTRAEHKHDIRKVLHRQLKTLWKTNSHLQWFFTDGQGKHVENFDLKPLLDGMKVGSIAAKFTVGDYHCVPLVTTDLELACGLDILFLRHDQPGATLIQSGDIDNRIKTLFDALRRPQNTAEIFGAPSREEFPFYCLLEDDKLITHLSVTTDYLLEPGHDVNDVHLVITVRVKPTAVTLANIGLGL